MALTTLAIALMVTLMADPARLDARAGRPAIGIWQLDVQVGDVVWQDRVEIREISHGQLIAWSDRMGDMRGILRSGVVILTSEYRPAEPMGSYIWAIDRPRSGRYCSMHIYPLEGIPDAFALRSFWHKATVRRVDPTSTVEDR